MSMFSKWKIIILSLVVVGGCDFFHLVKGSSQFNFLFPWASQYDSRRRCLVFCFL